MRTSALKNTYASLGATFAVHGNLEIPATTKGFAAEYSFVRDAVGITDFSHMRLFTIPEDTGIDFLDKVAAGNVARIRFGRVLHTFIADENGMLVADCYIANNDEEFVLMAETIIDDAAFDALLEKHGAKDAGLVDITATHSAISIDGCKAYAVVKEQFGADVLGLPYLSIEPYDFDGVSVRFFRLGKTSEFGYLVVAENGVAPALFTSLVALAEKNGGGACGINVHNNLRLEGRFFNIFAEGAAVRDPLPLGLQWMIDLDKDGYSGCEAILARREAGSTNKIVGLKSSVDEKAIAAGTAIYDGSEKVGEVIAATASPTLGASVALALLPVDIAYAGLAFSLGSAGGAAVETISMPPIMPKSLFVKLDDM